MRIRSQLAGVAMASTLAMAAIGCGSPATQVRASGTAATNGTVEPAPAAGAPKIWTLDDFAPTPLRGWHLSQAFRPRGRDIVLRFYDSDTLKVLGPGGSGPQSYNVNLTDTAAPGPLHQQPSATMQAYFHDHILERSLADPSDGPAPSHTLLDIAGHPAIEFVQPGRHFTTRSISLALNDHQEIDVVSTDLTPDQLQQAAAEALSK